MSPSNLTITRSRMVRAAGFVAAVLGLPGIAAASLDAAPQAPEVTPSTLMSLGMVVTPHEAVTSGVCPRNMAHVGKSCVDKYEGSLVEKLDDGSEVPYSPHEAPNGKNVRAVS